MDAHAPAWHDKALLWGGIAISVYTLTQIVKRHRQHGQKLALPGRPTAKTREVAVAVSSEATQKSAKKHSGDIPSDVLQHLAFSPSYDIREAARKLIAHRLSRDENYIEALTSRARDYQDFIYPHFDSPSSYTGDTASQISSASNDPSVSELSQDEANRMYDDIARYVSGTAGPSGSPRPSDRRVHLAPATAATLSAPTPAARHAARHARLMRLGFSGAPQPSATPAVVAPAADSPPQSVAVALPHNSPTSPGGMYAVSAPDVPFRASGGDNEVWEMEYDNEVLRSELRELQQGLTDMQHRFAELATAMPDDEEVQNATMQIQAALDDNARVGIDHYGNRTVMTSLSSPPRHALRRTDTDSSLPVGGVLPSQADALLMSLMDPNFGNASDAESVSEAELQRRRRQRREAVIVGIDDLEPSADDDEPVSALSSPSLQQYPSAHMQHDSGPFVTAPAAGPADAPSLDDPAETFSSPAEAYAASRQNDPAAEDEYMRLFHPTQVRTLNPAEQYAASRQNDADREEEFMRLFRPM